MQYSVLFHHILGIENTWRTNLSPEFLPELIQEGMGAVIAGLYLDGGYFFPTVMRKSISI